MNFNKLKFGATIGIIGGGQLGKMMAKSAQKMGYKVVVLDPSEDCPCRYVAHEFIQAKYDDENFVASEDKLNKISDPSAASKIVDKNFAVPESKLGNIVPEY
ncbi:NAD(P)-binding domain-containing protein, partial [Staphylococcus aureus]|uniref:NAD(P)-binding domain-containing protein n=1 Tax=Staphylococcus aureus TaxID=1280 RepID=UPI00210EF4DD